MATKTPVSILRELCVKKNIEETYTVISSHGPPNDCTFKICVETNTGLKATGTGKKKKEAQHNAAQALLEIMKAKGLMTEPKLISIDCPSIMKGPTTPITSSNSAAGLQTEKNVANANAVGRLNELCQKCNCGLPNYILVSQMGDPHRPIFTMRCEIGNLSATGASGTKQQAKQDAAHALYQKIASKPSDFSPAQGFSSAPPSPSPAATTCSPTREPAPRMTASEVESIIETYALCRPLTDVPLTEPNLKFGSYHTSMQETLSKVRADLDKQAFSSPVKTLESISNKLGVRVSYYEGRDITLQDTRSEKCFVYAIATTQPTTVQVGEGGSINAATDQAALNVLKYWQTFLGIFPVMY